MQVKDSKAYEYAIKVDSGEQIACKYIKQAAERFLYDITRKDLYWDYDKVEKITYFFEEVLYVPELMKPVPMPLPHAFWIQQLYGFRYKETNLRRFTDIFFEVARKNYKTYYAAGLSLCELIMGDDNMPMIMQGANTREQALICTDLTGKLIKCSPQISQIITGDDIRVYNNIPHTVHYTFNGRDGKIKAMPKNPGDGGNPSVAIIDELHEAKNLVLLQSMKSGQGAREQPLTLIISSPGVSTAVPMYTQIRKKAIDMLSGTIESDRSLALIYEQDNKDDWDKPECIDKANPMAPYSKTIRTFVMNEIAEAKRLGGSYEANVKIKNCGVWVDAAETWIQDHIIKTNSHGIKFEDLIGKECYVGIDLSKSRDLSAVGYLFPNIDGYWAFFVRCYIPQSKLEAGTDGIDYRLWVDKGWIQVHDGDVINHNLITSDTLSLMKQFDVKGVGFDQKFAYQGVIVSIAEAGYEELCESISQGFSLSNAVNDVERLTYESAFDFMDNPVLYWNFSNVVLTIGDKMDRYPSKKKSGDKIDLVSALLIAMTKYNICKAEPETEAGIMILN